MSASDGDRLLEVEGVYKRYSRTIPAKRRQFARQFSLAIAGRPDDRLALARDEFWGLHDVSFSVGRGEAVGLIGLNGAGKSTLLSIIARQILPDRGHVHSRGEIAAMINLTAGFEASLTGRENILLKGALAGRTRRQMLDCFSDIVHFADLEDFIESPIATYSSGMRMRLAFSLAVHTEPELLLIDEVLSVGDFRFRQKCLQRLNRLRAHASFIFVSHSLPELARFCDRLVLLRNGCLDYDGPVGKGLEHYVAVSREVGISATGSSDQEPVADGAPLYAMGPFLASDEIREVAFRWMTAGGEPVTEVRQGDSLIAEVSFAIEPRIAQGLVIGLPIWNSSGVLVGSVNSDRDGAVVRADAQGRISLRIRFPAVDFNPDAYYPVLVIQSHWEFVCRKPVAPLQVIGTSALQWGIVTPRVSWDT